MQEGSKLWVTCPTCPHTWAAAHLPMEMGKVARLMKGLHCPKCGGAKMFMATAAEAKAASEPPGAAVCPHGVRDERACHSCTPREDDFYITGTA
jgi:ssDNA-binding Zn-finger/Zn-ribbon topoisomerase 1